MAKMVCWSRQSWTRTASPGVQRCISKSRRSWSSSISCQRRSRSSIPNGIEKGKAPTHRRMQKARSRNPEEVRRRYESCQNPTREKRSQWKFRQNEKCHKRNRTWGKIIKNAIENWSNNWWKFQELSSTHADLKEKAEEIHKSYLKFPQNSRGFQPKEIGDLETYWSKALCGLCTIQICECNIPCRWKR